MAAVSELSPLVLSSAHGTSAVVRLGPQLSQTLTLCELRQRHGDLHVPIECRVLVAERRLR